jgi:cyclophilin family peptidyl-prolyl cis-trans isomerase
MHARGRAVRWLGLAGALATTFAFAEDATRVHFVTNLGEFTIAVQPERAPLTVANFLRYVREGQYSGTLIHRVVANFVIQGGGYEIDYKLKAVHDPVPNEAGNGLLNVRGSVGLARTSKPHSGDCQFYVNLSDNPELNPLASRWGYAVFGQVVAGMEVIDRIGLVATGAAGPLKADAPLQPVIIEKAEILDAAGARAQTPALKSLPVPATEIAPLPVPKNSHGPAH